MERGIRHLEGACQFGFEALEGLALRSLLVASNEVANVFADVLIRPSLADIGRHEFVERTAEAYRYLPLSHVA